METARRGTLSEAAPQLVRVLHYLLEFVGKFVSSKVTGRKLLAKQAEDLGSG
jgi:hypothetical protein